MSVQDGILLATGLHVHRSSAHSAGVGSIFDRCVFCIVVCARLRMYICVCVRTRVLWAVTGCGWTEPPMARSRDQEASENVDLWLGED